MNKRAALLEYLAGDKVGGYVPAAFFLHFGDDYRDGLAAIGKHQEFFAFTNMDFVKIQFELGFPRVKLSNSANYERIPCFALEYYGPQLEVVKGIVDALRGQALIVLTLYSPFMILGGMVGQRTVIKHLQQTPERVAIGLDRITDSLLDFVHACIRIGVDGFYHSTQGGEARRFESPETFLNWVKPTDHRVMNEIGAACPFNILHICDYHAEYGGYDDLTPFLDYPGTVVNVSTQIGGKTLAPAELSKFFGRPYMGGLDRMGILSSGTEAEARGAARHVLRNAPPKFILGADCTVPGTTPWANLRAAIDEAHGSGNL